MKFYGIQINHPGDRTKKSWYTLVWRRSSKYCYDEINELCLTKSMDTVNSALSFLNKAKAAPVVCEFELLRINDT